MNGYCQVFPIKKKSWKIIEIKSSATWVYIKHKINNFQYYNNLFTYSRKNIPFRITTKSRKKI